MQYHWLSVLSFITAALPADFETPPVPWDDMHVKHTWSAVPANWECLGRPSAGTTIDLYIALKAHRESALIDALYEVSDPGHLRYGAHLSKEQVAELVRPHPDTLELISSWLLHHGVQTSSISTTHGGAWLTVTDVLVSQANQLLSASYQLYRHAETDDTIIRTVGYALPAVLHTHIQTIAPTTYFASTSVLRQTPRRRSVGVAASEAEAASGKLVTVLSSRDGEVVPSYLRWLYKTFAYVPAATDQNTLGVIGFRDEYPSRVDLTRFMTGFFANARAATFTVEQVNGGGYDESNPGTEASIDVQWAEAIAYPTPLIFYSIGGRTEWSAIGKPIPGDGYLEWFNYMLGQQKIPQTISVSYGAKEQDFPQEYTEALCDMFAQLGLRGVSVLYAAGDDGVGAGNCNDGSGKVLFVPEFPASCPWVTSVGGTTRKEPEIAADLSGGGFSFHFPRPSYQDGTVPEYLKNLGKEKYAGLYNPKGRGIPDVAAQALEFVIVIKNAAFVVSGTSCSTPTVAGVISLLNDFLISKGRRPLGFLNPWLYGRGLPGFTDILSGSNPGCDTDGFSAVAGWDPVTGLGTPDFLKLQNILRGISYSTTLATAMTGSLPTPSITAEPHRAGQST